MVTAVKAYEVEDAENSSDPKAARTPFPGTLAGLLDTLAAARYRSAAGTPKVVVIVEGKQRTVIRRFEGGNEAWAMARKMGPRADATRPGSGALPGLAWERAACPGPGRGLVRAAPPEAVELAGLRAGQERVPLGRVNWSTGPEGSLLCRTPTLPSGRPVTSTQAPLE